MDYEQLRQWRDICELLEKSWYKFIEGDDAGKFYLLSYKNRPIRQELWSLYMIQLVNWTLHPINFYRSSRRSPYRKIHGWRLCPDWETKIDFLEQIILFNRNPDDIPQPWRREIWKAYFRREEQGIQQELLLQQIQDQRYQRRQAIADGGCPIGLYCKLMSGAEHSKDCENLAQCNLFNLRI